MSGPKSIIIVTREEVMEICRRQLAQLDGVIARIRAFAEQHGRLDRKLNDDIETRRERLQALFVEERFSTLQKQAPQAVEFLEDQFEAMRADVVKEKVRARERRRRVGDAASSLAIAYRAQNRALPVEIEAIARACRDGKENELAVFEKRIEATLRELSGAGTGPLGDTVLTKRLAEGTGRLTLQEWLANKPITTADLRLERLLAEVEALARPEEAAPFLARAAAIEEEPDELRRALLVDSLVVCP